MPINTKRIIANSLLELCEDKPLEKITVSEIIKKSEAGRQTFYNHFKDKNDLVFWIFKRTLRGGRDIVEKDGFYAYLCNVYSQAQQYRKFLKQACKLQGQNSLSEAIYLQTYNFYKLFILSRNGSKVFDDKLEFALRLYAHGACAEYIHWANEGMPGEASIQAQYALHCMPECIKQYLPLSEK